MAREKASRNELRADPDMMSLIGCSGDDFIAVLKLLGYRKAPPEAQPNQQDENPQAAKPEITATPEETAADASTDQADTSSEAPSEAVERTQPAPDLGPLYVRAGPQRRGRKPQQGQRKGKGKHGGPPPKQRNTGGRPKPNKVDADSPFAELAALKKSMTAAPNKKNAKAD